MRATITLLAILLGLAVVAGMFYHAGSNRRPVADPAPQVAANDAAPDPAPPVDPPAPPTPPADDLPQLLAPDAPVEQDLPDPLVPAPPADDPAVTRPDTPTESITGLRLLPFVNEHTVVLGSDEPREAGYKLKVEITSWGAGIRRLTLADYRMGADGVWGELPYTIIDTPGAALAWYAATSMSVNGVLVNLATESQWEILGREETSDQASITLRATVVNEDDMPVVQVVRTFQLIRDSYDLRLEQRIYNLTDKPLEIAFAQIGQGDMIQDPAAYMGDRREYVTGYFNPPYAGRRHIFAEGSHINRGSLASDPRIWPNPQLGRNDRYELAWIAAENRYFAVVTHPPIGGLTTTEEVQPLTDIFGTMGVSVTELPASATDRRAVTLTLARGATTVEPGQSLDLSIGVYAGPRKKEVLANPPYAILHLDQLVRYNIGGMCAWCTFQWLANGLLGFMRWIHWLANDWGIAIIVLVICVRVILHPITKKAQINMMKMGKQMAALQPEIEKIKNKYKDDTQKLNAEMMKLYREKGVNPAGFLGCLPMLLQTPIWIALYAMLYFAIELRHEPAFYGLFQAISGGHWHFLRDLSVSDSFIRFIPPEEPGVHIPLLSGFLGPVRALNILPLMMAVVFYINQKLTTPPPANEQQAQQQKIMKFMVLLFPVFLYNAPSGLTLYIFTSTLFGILDGYIVRKHIKEQEEAGTLFDKKPRKPGGFMDRMSKMMEQKQLDMQQKQRELQKGQNPPKKRRK